MPPGPSATSRVFALCLLFFLAHQVWAQDYGVALFLATPVAHINDPFDLMLEFSLPVSPGFQDTYTLRINVAEPIILNFQRPVECDLYTRAGSLRIRQKSTTAVIGRNIDVEIPAGTIVVPSANQFWGIACTGFRMPPDPVTNAIVLISLRKGATEVHNYGAQTLSSTPGAGVVGTVEHTFIGSNPLSDVTTSFTLRLDPLPSLNPGDSIVVQLPRNYVTSPSTECEAFTGLTRHRVQTETGAMDPITNVATQCVRLIFPDGMSTAGGAPRMLCKNIRRVSSGPLEAAEFAIADSALALNYVAYVLNGGNLYQTHISFDTPSRKRAPKFNQFASRISYFTNALKKAAMTLTVDNFVWSFLTGDELSITFPDWIEIDDDVSCTGRFLGLSLGTFNATSASNNLRLKLGTNLSTVGEFIRGLFTTGLPSLPSFPGFPTSGLFQITCEGIGPTVQSLVSQTALGTTFVNGVRSVVGSIGDGVDLVRDQFGVFGDEAEERFEEFKSVMEARGTRVTNFIRDLYEDAASALGIPNPTAEDIKQAAQDAIAYLSVGPRALYEDSILRFSPAWEDLRDTVTDTWKDNIEPALVLPDGFRNVIDTTEDIMQLGATNILDPTVWNRFSTASTLKAAVEHSVGYVDALGDMRFRLSSLPFSIPAGSYFQIPLGNYLQFTQDSLCTVNGVATTYTLGQGKVTVRIPQALSDTGSSFTEIVCSGVKSLAVTPTNVPLTDLGSVMLLNSQQNPLTEIATSMLNQIRGIGTMGTSVKQLQHSSDTVSTEGTLSILVEPLDADVVDELDVLFPATYSSGPLLSLASPQGGAQECEIFYGSATLTASITEILEDGIVKGFRLIPAEPIVRESSGFGLSSSQPLTVSCPHIRRARNLHGNVNKIDMKAFKGHGSSRVLVSQTTSAVLNGVAHAPSLPPLTVKLDVSEHSANTLVTADLLFKSLNVSLIRNDLVTAILPEGYSFASATSCTVAGEDEAEVLVNSPTKNGATLTIALPVDIPARSADSQSEEIPSLRIRCQNVRTPLTARSATVAGQLSITVTDSQQRKIVTSNTAETPLINPSTLREGTSLTSFRGQDIPSPGFGLRFGLSSDLATSMSSSLSQNDNILIVITAPESWASTLTSARVASQDVKCYMGGEGNLNIGVVDASHPKLSVQIRSAALSQGRFRSIICSGIDTSQDELSPISVVVKSPDGAIWAASHDVSFVSASFATSKFSMQVSSSAASSIADVSFVVNGLPVDMEPHSSFRITIPHGWTPNVYGNSQCTIAQTSSTAAVLGPEASESDGSTTVLSSSPEALQVSEGVLVISISNGPLARGSGSGFDTTITCTGFRLPNAASAATLSNDLTIEARVGDIIVGRKVGGTIPAVTAASLLGTAAITFSLPRVSSRTDMIISIAPLTVDLLPRDEIGLQLPLGFSFNANGEASSCTVSPNGGTGDSIALAISRQEGPTVTTFTMALPDSAGATIPASAAGAKVQCTNILTPSQSLAARSDLTLQITATQPSVSVRAVTNQASLQAIEPGRLGDQIAVLWASAPVINTITSLAVTVRPFENPVPSGGAFTVRLPSSWVVDAGGATSCTASQALVPLVGTTQTVVGDGGSGPVLKFKLSVGETLKADRVFVMTCTRVRTPLQTEAAQHDIEMWTENASGAVIDRTTAGELAEIGTVLGDVSVQITNTFNVQRFLSSAEVQALANIFQGYLGGISSRVQIYRQLLRPRTLNTFAHGDIVKFIHTASIDTSSPQFLHGYAAANTFAAGSAGAEAEAQCNENQGVVPGTLAASQSCLSADAAAMRAAVARETQVLELRKADAKQESGLVSFALNLIQGTTVDSAQQDMNRVTVLSEGSTTTEDSVLDVVVLLGSNTPTGVASTFVSLVDAAQATPLHIQNTLGPLPLSISAPSTVFLPKSCSDAQRNNDETDVDCGGNSCAQCRNGARCLANRDCLSGRCSGNVCLAASSGGDGGGSGSGGSTSAASPVQVAYILSLVAAPLLALVAERLTR